MNNDTDSFIGKVKDSIKDTTGKEASHLMRNLKPEEGIIVGDTHIYLSESHLSNHVTVRIFTPKENKIVFLDKNGRPKIPNKNKAENE